MILKRLDFIRLRVSRNNHLDFKSVGFSDFRLMSKKYFIPFLVAVMSGVTEFPELFYK